MALRCYHLNEELEDYREGRPCRGSHTHVSCDHVEPKEIVADLTRLAIIHLNQVCSSPYAGYAFLQLPC
jgi:hypothetical protein